MNLTAASYLPCHTRHSDTNVTSMPMTQYLIVLNLVALTGDPQDGFAVYCPIWNYFENVLILN